MTTNTEKIYQHLKTAQKRMSVAAIADALKLERTSASSLLTQMNTRPHKYPGLTKTNRPGGARGYLWAVAAADAQPVDKRKPDQAESIAATIAESIAPEPSSLDALVQQLADAFASKVSAAFVATMQNRLQADMAKLIAHQPVAPTQTAPAPRGAPQIDQIVVEQPKLPKVLVVGLLPQQAGLIQKEFHECFDLSFRGAGESSHRIQDDAKYANHVILVRDFINHKVTEAVAAVNKNSRLVAGGITRVRDTLTTLYINGAKA